MKKYLLIFFSLTAFLFGCQKNRNAGKESDIGHKFDRAKLLALVDTMRARSDDTTFCDTLLLHVFSNKELVKKYPGIAGKAFNAALLTHPFKAFYVLNLLNNLVKKTGNEHLKAWYNYNIGRMEQNVRDNKSAIQYLLSAEKGFEQFSDTFGLSLSNKRLGEIYFKQMGDTTAALKYSKLALTFSKYQIDSFQSILNISRVYIDNGNTDSATTYIHSMYKLYHQSSLAYIQLNFYFRLKQMDKGVSGSADSVKKYFSLFCIYETLPLLSTDFNELTAASAAYGKVLTHLKKYDEAEEILKKGLGYSTRDTGSSFKERRDLYGELYNLYDQRNNNSSALKYLKLKNEFETKFNDTQERNDVKIAEERYKFNDALGQMKVTQEITGIELAAQRKQKYYLLAGLAVVIIFAVIFLFQRTRISKEKKRSDELLLNILPSEVAEELKQKGSAEAKMFDEVTVMFTDFKNFTQITEKLSPAELVSEIHSCFKSFDNIIDKYNIEKIKTIGDSYMAAGGLPVANKTNAVDIVSAALEIQQFMEGHKLERIAAGKEVFEIRIGIHTGPVVAGIVGIKKFAYDIWGDTVNIASRMESSGQAGKVNISESTYQLVKDKFHCTHRGKIDAKNKGVIDMYFVEEKLPA